MIINKAYQKHDTVSSVVTTIVKGQGYIPVNKKINKNLLKINPNYLEELYQLNESLEYKVLDTADYVIPPNEYNSIFIMTNFIRTDQMQGTCDEEPGKYRAECSNDSYCKKLGPFMSSWNGNDQFNWF